MRFWDRLKWAVIGGFGYMLGRFLFEYFRQFTGGYCFRNTNRRSCGADLNRLQIYLVLQEGKYGE